jgi:hypothetical protein
LEEQINFVLYLQHWRAALEAAQAMSSSPEVPPTLSTNDQGSVRAFARLAIQEGFLFCVAAFSVLLRFCLSRRCNFFGGAAFSVLPHFLGAFHSRRVFKNDFVAEHFFIYCVLAV